MPEIIPTDAVRQSALAAAACLKRFHEVYDLGLEDDSDESRRGVAFHHIALEQYVPHLVQTGREADHAAIADCYNRGIRACRTPAHLLEEVEDLIWKWAEGFRLDHQTFWKAETRFSFAGVSFKPDLIYAHRATPRGSLLRIRDLKTWHAILNEEAARAEFQGQLYIHQAMELWPGFDAYDFEWQFVRYGDAVTVVSFTRDELQSLGMRVRARLDTIEDARRSGEWPAQPGEACGFCRLKCDVVDDERVLDRRIATPEEARIVGGRAIVAKRIFDADIKALKAWATTEGPVRVEGVEWAHRETERAKYPIPEVLDAFEASDVTPPPFECGKTILKKWIGTKKAQQAWPRLVETITALARTEIKTRFSAKKVGDVAPDQDAGDDAGEE